MVTHGAVASGAESRGCGGPGPARSPCPAHSPELRDWVPAHRGAGGGWGRPQPPRRNLSPHPPPLRAPRAWQSVVAQVPSFPSHSATESRRTPRSGKGARDGDLRGAGRRRPQTATRVPRPRDSPVSSPPRVAPTPNPAGAAAIPRSSRSSRNRSDKRPVNLVAAVGSIATPSRGESQVRRGVASEGTRGPGSRTCLLRPGRGCAGGHLSLIRVGLDLCPGETAQRRPTFPSCT